MFPVLLINVEVKNTICNSLVTVYHKLVKIGWSELYKILNFVYKQLFHMLTIPVRPDHAF